MKAKSMSSGYEERHATTTRLHMTTEGWQLFRAALTLQVWGQLSVHETQEKMAKYADKDTTRD